VKSNHSRLLASLILALLWQQVGIAYASIRDRVNDTSEISRKRIEFKTIWQLGPVVVTSPGNPIDDKMPIYSMRLLPKKLFQAKSAIVSNSEVNLLPSGAQFVLMNSERKIVCALTTISPNAESTDDRACLISSSGDNNFDGYFVTQRKIRFSGLSRSIVALKGTLPSGVVAIKPLNLEEIDPNLFEHFEYLRLLWTKGTDSFGQISLYTSVGEMIPSPIRCSSFVNEGDTPSEIKCFTVGASIRALRRQGKKFEFEVLPNNLNPILSFTYRQVAFNIQVVGFVVN
jgi:hypothetical protein